MNYKGPFSSSYAYSCIDFFGGAFRRMYFASFSNSSLYIFEFLCMLAQCLQLRLVASAPHAETKVLYCVVFVKHRAQYIVGVQYVTCPNAPVDWAHYPSRDCQEIPLRTLIGLPNSRFRGELPPSPTPPFLEGGDHPPIACL